MKVLFENDNIPTKIKDPELFNKMESEAWSVSCIGDAPKIIYDDIDELTGKFVDRCYIVHFPEGEHHLVEVSFATDIVYGDYKKVE